MLEKCSQIDQKAGNQILTSSGDFFSTPKLSKGPEMAAMGVFSFQT